MKWCSDCGLEHIDSATSCADCGGALTGQQPPAPPVPVAEPKDHRTEVIDIAHLDDDQRLMLPQLRVALLRFSELKLLMLRFRSWLKSANSPLSEAVRPNRSPGCTGWDTEGPKTDWPESG